HDPVTADADLRVPDLPVGPRHAHDLLPAERLLVDLERLRRTAHAEVRRHRVVSGRDRLDPLLGRRFPRRCLPDRFFPLHGVSFRGLRGGLLRPGRRKETLAPAPGQKMGTDPILFRGGTMDQPSLQQNRPYSRPEPRSFPWIEAVLAILLTAGTIYLFY